jgi:hypothetical protein
VIFWTYSLHIGNKLLYREFAGDALRGESALNTQKVYLKIIIIIIIIIIEDAFKGLKSIKMAKTHFCQKLKNEGFFFLIFYFILFFKKAIFLKRNSK